METVSHHSGYSDSQQPRSSSSSSSYLLSSTTPPTSKFITSNTHDSLHSITDQTNATGTTSTSVTTTTTTTTTSNTSTAGKSTYTLGKEIEIELGSGVSKEDTKLAKNDKNAIDFVFDYCKLWCKTCKDLVLTLEKRATAENESTRIIMKQFQLLESNTINQNGAPYKKQTLNLCRMMIDHCKEVETNNSKRCRELLEVLNRQRTLFEKTRKFLKDKWKADVKRMLDAENSLFKTKTTYYQRCQAGVKLREELATAQNLLNELTASLMQSSSVSFSGALSSSASTGTTTPSSSFSSVTIMPPTQTNVSGLPVYTTGTSYSSNLMGSTVGSNANLTQDLMNDSNIGESNPSNTTSSLSTSTSNQVAKQRVKVERLEKQLGDNDKKEIELMYAYREAVDIANHRLCELEKSKIEILCDTRLTITKSDEVVKDSLAELLNHLYTTRSLMIKQYEIIANAYQDYVPCSDYRALVELHIQKGTEFIPEKYHFDGFHESKLDTSRLTSRLGKDSGDSTLDILSAHRNLLSLHSDSDSDTEATDLQLNTSGRNSTSLGVVSGGGSSSSSGTGNTTTSSSNNTSLSSSGVASGIVSTSSNVLSTIVEFGSNLFRPDSKKSIRNKRSTINSLSNSTAPPINPIDNLETIAIHEANLEREYLSACYPVARCIAAIEKQENGLATHGIYRVPASKAKVSNLMDLLQSNQLVSSEQIQSDIDLLSQEHPLTLASLVKTQLIALPEPLLTYNLYPNFVELGKAFDLVDSNITDELMKRLQLLINHLSPGNRQLAGLIFHHLHRVAECQSENQMGAVNLGTMFAPTVLRQRPKFQVANMMEFMDNKGQTKVVELLIDRVFQVFGSSEQYDPIKLITAHITSNDDKTTIADYNRMNSARGSISLANCERSKSTCSTIVDSVPDTATNMSSKIHTTNTITTITTATTVSTTTSNKTVNTDIPTSTTFTLVGTTNSNTTHTTNSNNHDNIINIIKVTTTTLPSSGLLRSATISVSPQIRPTGTLLTGALPLYTPYRQNQGFNKDSANIEETPSNTSSDITVSSLHGADKHDKIHKRYNPVIYDKPTNIKPGMRLQDLAKPVSEPTVTISSQISNPPTTGIVTTTSTTTTTTVITSASNIINVNEASPSSSSSIVRGIKKLYSSSGQHSISPSTIASSITTSKLFHSSDKQNISNTSSTDPNTNTALSSLIIGRRKPLGRLLALHQTVENSDDVSPVNPTNLDQYSFIDNDLPDSSNG
uniref:Rho-GAP domain-containing protein n=1 Tax=Schistosoma mansoni TaxID=6183 RepID=A0A3Q0KNL3_SCHMA